MLRIILPLLALLLVASPARAFVSQSPAGAADAKAQAKTGADKYVELLDKLKKGDRTVDFRELRMTYTETKDYNPYGNDRAERQAMFAALSNKKWDEVLKHSEKMLEKNYVDLNAHYGAYVAQREKGNAEKADFHKFVLTGLVDSIRGKGDGKSMEQAFVVISTDEEYALLNFLGLRTMVQGLTTGGGHSYDRMTVIDPSTKTQLVFYFQIDKPFGWLGKSLKSN